MERAGEVVGLENREKAELWYAGHVSSRSGRETDAPSLVEDPVLLEDLTQEDLDQSGRLLKITPIKQGRGLSDVSINHDEYLCGDSCEA